MRLNIIDNYIKGLKGQFRLSKSFYPQSPNVKTSFHIFDHTINQFLRMVQRYGDLFIKTR